MKSFDIKAIYLYRMLEGARRKKFNYEQLLLKNGVSNLSLTQEHAAIPVDRFAHIMQQLIETMGDEYIGLGERVQPVGSFKMAAYACLSCHTIKQSLLRYANFRNLFSNTFRHEVQINSDRIAYVLHPLNNKVNDYLTESIFLTIHRFHCWLSGQFIPLRSVTFSYPNPNPSINVRANFYNAPVQFNAPLCRFEFDPSYLNLEVSQNMASLSEYLSATGLSLIYHPRSFRLLSDKIKQWLTRQLQSNPDALRLSHVAEHFLMSEQILHRRLLKENTSFKEIKQEVRQELSYQLLNDSRYKIEHIAQLTGFSEPSAFIRAFKKWTGKTPLQYRHLKKR